MTSSGLVGITIWYSIFTPLVTKTYAEVQKLEREAAGFAADALSGIKMIAACGAEEKIAESYGKMVNEMGHTTRGMSLVLALQHAPGIARNLSKLYSKLTIDSVLHDIRDFCTLLLVCC